MIELIQVTVATNSKQNADEIANSLVTKRLAASVWVSGPIASNYWWKEEVQRAEEWVCTAKTQRNLYSKVEEAIKKIHPYEVPGILALPVLTGSQSYLEWAAHETRTDSNDLQKQISQKEEFLQELGKAHECLIEAATKAYKRGVTRKEDKWGPCEIMAHIAGWEAKAITYIPKFIAGKPNVQYDHDTFNAIVTTLIGDEPFEVVCSILRKTYQHDIEMHRALDESLFTTGGYVYERIQAAIHHCYEHAQGLDVM